MSARRLNVVLFSGGSGTGTIVDALLRHPQLFPTLLINAYDDGHSTGRLRRYVPGMLGPSDVRKNVNRLMPRTEERHRALRSLADRRLPEGASAAEGMRLCEGLAGDAALPSEFASLFDRLSVSTARMFQAWVHSFLDYAADRPFDFSDCAVGNLLFAGAFLANGRCFNAAVRSYSELFEIEGQVLNVTRGENLFLVARTDDGRAIRTEAELVSLEAQSRIRRLYLVDEAIYRENAETSGGDSWIERGARIPELNPDARLALESADIVIYGPGTQHSSLLPSYLTRGVAEAISGNRGIDKVFISNIRRDVDIQHEDAEELAAKFVEAMTRYGETTVAREDLATHFFFQRRTPSDDPESLYVPFDERASSLGSAAVTVRDWEAKEGQHSGGYVLQELRRLIQTRIGAAIAASPYMVSIVVPALNEERTVEEALRGLTELDFVAFDMSKEIVLVDGGSTDATFERACSVPGVRTFRTSSPKGRGSALRFGIEQARGDIVVFFPSDLEYTAGDLYNVVFSIVRNGFRIVFGTRTVKCTDLESRLKKIYGGKRVPYLISKYGGMLLSTATLFLYNRYVTDTLTSIKGFDAKTLRSLDLRSDGMDLDAEIVAKACRAGLYILEVPVEYRARTRAEGKKSTALDGLKALWTLFACRR